MRQAWAVVLIAVTVVVPEVSAQDLTPVGHFASIRVSSATGEPHCYGLSLTLWAHGTRVLGLLDRHEGLCGDPPCVLLPDVSFDRGTGALSFAVTDVKGSEFVGTLRRDDIVGTLDGQRVRLERKTDDIFGTHDRQLESWCQFWSKVPRCRGVREFCASIGGSR